MGIAGIGIAAIFGGATASSVVTGAIIGAGAGAIGSAICGGDPWRGAGIGALTGGIGGIAGGFAGGFGGASTATLTQGIAGPGLMGMKYGMASKGNWGGGSELERLKAQREQLLEHQSLLQQQLTMDRNALERMKEIMKPRDNPYYQEVSLRVKAARRYTETMQRNDPDEMMEVFGGVYA